MKSKRGRYKKSEENDRYEQLVRPGTWHVKDWLLTFGKYKGMLLKDAIDNDPSYMAWACDTIDGFASNLTDKMLRKCKASRTFSTARPKPKTGFNWSKPSGLVEEVKERIAEKLEAEEHLHSFMPEAFEPQEFEDGDEPPW